MSDYLVAEPVHFAAIPIYTMDMLLQKLKLLWIFCIMIQSLGENSKIIAIPRIRFKFRLPFGQSYQLRRTQYPLRRACRMSVNKSQRQEEESVLLDL